MENNNELNLNLTGFTKEKLEIIRREGVASAPKEPLPTKAPEVYGMTGVIDTPANWLEKRIKCIDIKKANVEVNREEMTVKLTINEDDAYNKNSFIGTVAFSQIFEKMGINNGQKAWIPAELGQFFRINRHIFRDKEECMLLVSKLKNFMATTNAKIQKMKDPSGSRAEVYNSSVESNLPKSFIIDTSIFKGTAKESIEVEFDHFIKDSDVYLQLISPGASELVEAYKDKCIDSVLDRIKIVAPEIPILEK